MRCLLPPLLILALLQQTGMTLLLSGMQQAHKRAMKKRISVSMTSRGLYLLKIPLSIEHDPGETFVRTEAWEFRYCGRMYDIVRQETHADTTWYYCVFDKQETELAARLTRHLQHAAERKAAAVIRSSSPPAPGPLFCAARCPDLPARRQPGQVTPERTTPGPLWQRSPDTPPPQV